MKLHGDAPETASWQAAAANAGLGASRLAAGLMTSNLGFVTDSIHDASDLLSFGAKAEAIKRDQRDDAVVSRRLRLGALGIIASSGVASIGAGIYTSLGHHAETANPTTIAIATATTAVAALIERVTHRAKHRHGEHGAVHDTHNHAASDFIGNVLYTAALGGQYASDNPQFGAGGLAASGIVTLVAAGKTLRSIQYQKPPSSI